MGLKRPLSDPKDVIIIARHGKPALSRKVRLSWRQFRAWWDQYDEGGLAEGQMPPKKIQTLAQDADILISSSLRRARETAYLLRGQEADMVDEVFVEAALPPPHLPFLKLKPKTWGTLARICWFWGFPDDMENVHLARARASRAADILEGHAQGGKTVVLTAHGWFNRMIKTHLLRRGWVCVKDQGDLHWKFRRYERKTDETQSE